MIKIKPTALVAITLTIFAVQILPIQARADLLQMPQTGTDLAAAAGINAQAYVVEDVQTGKVLISKNADMAWPPASLTKLVTALVVLDTKPNLSKQMALTSFDQTLGACTSGGDCIKGVVGTKFTVDGLFHAAMMPSANNAASALARSTGLTEAQFVARMNKKVADLGATGSHFNEPTGMDPTNTITAGDYSKILIAAFSSSYLKQIAGLTSYTLKSPTKKYTQVIKNTNKLLTADGVQVIGAKTGYLDESHYNFASELRYQGGPLLAIVVLGEDHMYTAFNETTELASLAQQSQMMTIASVSESMR